MTFTKAIKRESKLRMAIAGPSGSGKTYTALAIASALANGKPVAMVDTEHGSASKYADLFQFDVLEMHPPYHPDRFVEAINEAAKAGYGVVILDSLTHAWSGTGGLLEIVDQIAARMRSQNSFAAWKDATPIQNRLVEAIVAAPLHVIATMRSKQEYVVQQDERGKQAPRKVGMAPQQREGFEYEFDVFGEMDIENTMLVTKSRCPALSGAVIKKPGADVAVTLTTWLHGVAQPAPSTHPQAPAWGAQFAGWEARRAYRGMVTIDKDGIVLAADAGGSAVGELVSVAQDGQVDTPPADPYAVTDAQRRMFHALGKKIYGQEWGDVGKAMIREMTGGSEHTSDMFKAQMTRLIDQLKAEEASLMAAEAMTGAQATAELFGDAS